MRRTTRCCWRAPTPPAPLYDLLCTSVYRGAGQNCPISQALKGNIEITVQATLDG
jgi:hypothetical protein